MHSFLLSSQNNSCGKVHHALYRVTMLSCVLVVPPQDQVMISVPTKDNTSTSLLFDSPLQQTASPVLRKKTGIRDLGAAFHKLQKPMGSSCSSSTDTNDSSTLFTNLTSLLSVSDHSESANSVFFCSHDERQSVADRNEHTTAEALQHGPASTRLRRKTALSNLRGAFKLYDRTRKKVYGAPFFIDAAHPTAPTSSPIKSSNQAIEADVTLSQADCQPVYIPLPLPPPLRHEEVVADIPFVPRPLTRGVPVHRRARMHVDLTIPSVWRGRSMRYH